MCQENNGGGWWLTRTGFDPLKAFLSLLLACLGVSAATPSFNSFEPTQFSTNGLRVSLQEPLVVTNLYSSNIFVTNITANTIYTTNIYATNLYVTNIYNDITFNGRVTFNTNVFLTQVNNSFNTNQFWTNSAGQIINRDSIYFTSRLSESGPTLTNINAYTLPSGTNDILTIPAGYMATTVTLRISTTNSGSLGTVTRHVATNGVYYPVGTAIALTTNSFTVLSTTFSANFGMLENETVSLVTTTAGATVQATFFLFPTNSALRVSKLYSLSAGNNTLYTAPVGKRAISYAFTSTPMANITTAYWNQSSGNRIVRWHLVPNGGSADESNVIQQETVANNNLSSVTFHYLDEGESMVLNTDASTATQLATFVCLEIDR